MMPEIPLNKQQYLELEKLSVGAFAPINGFLREDDFHSVVRDMRLASGAPFPLPVVLDVDDALAATLKSAPRVPLTYDGMEVGEITAESVFTCDKPAVARTVFGTDEPSHPGARFFIEGGDWFVGGPITLKRRASLDISAYEIDPVDARRQFAERGWQRVVGFQTRNVPHRAHEYLQKIALEQTDGLFIQPLVGRKKAGDYLPEAIMTGYRALIENYFRPERVVLGILSTSMRYAGPREAVFHAIIRRNYGCTHFIVGRDHAGVGDYYRKYEAHDLCRRFEGELGIKVMCLHGPFYCRGCDGYATEHTCPHWERAPGQIEEISGTDMRAVFRDGLEPDPHLMRPEVVAALRGQDLFVTEDEA